jgi:hypothetical protein
MGLQRKILLLFLLLLFCFAVQAQTTVYITKTGKKYHQSTCQYLSKSSISIELSKAKENSYTACSVCSGGSSAQTKAKASTSQQCSGKTKTGNRCKRMTTGVNGRCYQH